MGRVSRIIKAASEKRTEAPPVHGLEERINSSDPELPRVIAAWPHMPIHLKRTIMTLVEVVESKRATSPPEK